MNVGGNTIQSVIYGQDKKKKTNLRIKSDLLTAPVIIHWLNLAGVETKALRDASGSPEVTGRKRQRQVSSQAPLITSPTWGHFTLYASWHPWRACEAARGSRCLWNPSPNSPQPTAWGNTHKTLENAFWDFIDLDLNSLGLVEAVGVLGLKVNCRLQLQSMGSQRSQTWLSY